MPATTGQELFLKQAEVKLTDSLQKLDKEAYYRKVCAVQSANTKIQRVQELENMSALARRIEGAPIQELDFLPGYAQQFIQIEYAGKVVMTFQMKTFQQYDLFGRLSAQLKNASAKTPDLIFAVLLEYGDVALASVPTIGNGEPIINSLGGDGLTLFHATHTFKSDGERTWSNKYTTSQTLDETSVGAIRTQIRRWKDNTGAPFNYKITKFILPPDKMQDYWRLAKSTNQPATNNNAVNTFPYMAPDSVIEMPLLQDTTDWYVCTDAPDEGKIQFFEGYNKTKSYEDDHIDSSVIATMRSFSIGANRLRGILKVTT